MYFFEEGIRVEMGILTERRISRGLGGWVLVRNRGEEFVGGYKDLFFSGSVGVFDDLGEVGLFVGV